MQRVASIDVGVLNLALVIADVDVDGIVEVVHMERTDTTAECERSACSLGHTRTAADRLSHYVRDRQGLFDQCTTVLIERQPPAGLTDVEQLLFAYFRSKAVLISPNAMHKMLGIGNFSYEVRKWHTVQVTERVLQASHHANARATFYALGERKHDVADAVCMLLFYVRTSLQAAEPKPAAADTTRSKKSKAVSKVIEQKQEEDESTPEERFATTMSRFMYKPQKVLTTLSRSGTHISQVQG